MSLISKTIHKLIAFSQFVSNNSFQNHFNFENKHKSNTKKVYVFSVAWGDYLDNYFNSTVPSIFQSSNLPALAAEEFDISLVLYTLEDPEKVSEKYRAIIDKYMPDNFTIEKIETNQAIVKYIMNVALLRFFRKAIDDNALFIWAPPDIIFSNGSLYNSVMSVYYKGVCFASMPVRVEIDILKDESVKAMIEKGTVISSPKLVEIGLKNLHENFIYANDELDENTTHYGVSIRKITDQIYNVIGNMPSVWVAKPLEEDYRYFFNIGDFNQWDRGWLELLVKRNRLKIGGSSDQFFCVELTKNDMSFMAKKQKGQLGNDYSGDGFATRVCNMVNVIWRTDI